MEKSFIDCLETNIPKVEGVATLLVLMASNPRNIGALDNTGSAYDLLARTLEEVSEDLNEQLVVSMTANSQKEVDDASDYDIL